MIELRTPAQIEAMRPAGRFVAEVLVALRDAADVGVNPLDLDRLAHEMIKERGAESCHPHGPYLRQEWGTQHRVLQDDLAALRRPGHSG